MMIYDATFSTVEFIVYISIPILFKTNAYLLNWRIVYSNFQQVIESFSLDDNIILVHLCISWYLIVLLDLSPASNPGGTILIQFQLIVINKHIQTNSLRFCRILPDEY